MKKFLLLTLVLVSFGASAQVKLGLKVAPIFISNRVSNEAQTADHDGSVTKFSIGLTVDKPFADAYLLSSGLVYVPKRVAFRDSDLGIIEEYNVQYLQIPLTVKLFTNEVAPDMKVYFQIGGGLEFKVFDEPLDPDYNLVETFNAVDIPVILGAGVEYRAGLSTVLYGGISYQRGLTNSLNQVTDTSVEDLMVRNTVVSIDFGVKF